MGFCPGQPRPWCAHCSHPLLKQPPCLEPGLRVLAQGQKDLLSLPASLKTSAPSCLLSTPTPAPRFLPPGFCLSPWVSLPPACLPGCLCLCLILSAPGPFPDSCVWLSHPISICPFLCMCPCSSSGLPVTAYTCVCLSVCPPLWVFAFCQDKERVSTLSSCLDVFVWVQVCSSVAVLLRQGAARCVPVSVFRSVCPVPVNASACIPGVGSQGMCLSLGLFACPYLSLSRCWSYHILSHSLRA